MQRSNEQRTCHVSLSLSLEPSSPSISDDIREGQDSLCLRVLELKTGDFSLLDCTKAYKRLGLKYHPYKNNSAAAGDKFKEVSRAYRKLYYQEETSLETEELNFSMFDDVYTNQTFHKVRSLLHDKFRGKTVSKLCEGRGCPICHEDHHQRGFRKVNRSMNKKKTPGRKQEKRKDEKSSEQAEELKPMKAIIPEVEDIDEHSVSLRWSKPIGIKVELYTLEVAYGSTGVNSKHYHIVYQGKQTSYQVPNLKAGTQYCFRLKFSHFMLGESPWGPVFLKTQGKADDSAHPEILSNVQRANLRKREKKRLKRARQKARKKEKESPNISKKTQTGTQKQQKQTEPESEQIKKSAEISPKVTAKDKSPLAEEASVEIISEKPPAQPPSETSFTTPAQSVISSPTPSGPKNSISPEILDEEISFSTAKKRKKKKKKIDQKQKMKQVEGNLLIHVTQAGVSVEQYIDLENHINTWRKNSTTQSAHIQEQHFEKVMTNKLRAKKLPKDLLTTLFGESRRRLIRDGPREALVAYSKRSTELRRDTKEKILGATKHVKSDSVQPIKLVNDGVARYKSASSMMKVAHRGPKKAPLAKVWTISEGRAPPPPPHRVTATPIHSVKDISRGASQLSPLCHPPSPLYKHTPQPFVETPPRQTMTRPAYSHIPNRNSTSQARGASHPNISASLNAPTPLPQHAPHNILQPQSYVKPRANTFDINPFYNGYDLHRGSVVHGRQSGNESKHNSSNSFDLSGVLSPLGIDMNDLDREQLGPLYSGADNL